MFDWQVIFQGVYNVNIMLEWLEYIKGQDYFGLLLLKLYVDIFRVFFDEGQEYYFDVLLGEFDMIFKVVFIDCFWEIYFMVINYCVCKIRQGQECYVEEVFLFYMKGIECCILMEQDNFLFWIFMNVVKLVFCLKWYQWIE